MEKENTSGNKELINFEFKLRSPEDNQEEKVPSIPSPRKRSFGDIGERYVTSLQLLWTYIRSIAQVAQKTNSTNIISLMILISEIASPDKEKPNMDKCIAIADISMTFRNENNEEETFHHSLNIADPRHVTRILDHTKYYNAAKGILYESAIQQLANTYEYLIGELLRLHLHSNPDAAPKDQNISY